MRPVLCVLAASLGLVAGETGIDGWLRYAPLSPDQTKGVSVPLGIVALNATESSPVHTAGRELHKGLLGILGKELPLSNSYINDSSSIITVGTVAAFTAAGGRAPEAALRGLADDGYWLSTHGDDGAVQILGRNERGALYGAFAYLERLARGDFSAAAYASNPSAPLRWVNQWDNLDGSIERGYAGPSIFFAGGRVVDDLTRAGQYARLLASVGVNALVVNNVNADPRLLNATNVAGLGRLAAALRPWGLRLGVSLNFDAPRTLGGLPTADPLDAAVGAWWDGASARLHAAVPDLAGFLVKANSESQPGPLTYNRTLAEGANLFARALRAHGAGDGVVMFRAFVYDHHLDEADWRADRANAAVDFFRGLDGAFDANVVVQVKYGPIDFQVREPASPLFAHLRRTGAAIELQVAQEYLGQQSHLVYLPPLWKTVLDFDLRADGAATRVRDVVSGARFGQPLAGYAAVVNVGAEASWLGSHLAMANLYAYGRLAWDPTADAAAVLDDWTRLTFGSDPAVVAAVAGMAMASWPAYENYTGNLGVQTLTDITGPHYGPKPQSQDGNGWGQWTRADATSIGMDRTVGNGTGFAGQYPAEVAARFEDPATTPDELLLWFHHVPYTHRLRGTGAGADTTTVLQHFYDAHYAGAATAQTFPAQWEAAARGRVDAERFAAVAFRLAYQAGHALVWRDAINDFYRAKSGIADARGRVGRHPWRLEAEAMALAGGYAVVAVDPWEAASGARAIAVVAAAAGTPPRSNNATASTAPLAFPAGVYDVAVNYYDVGGGRARWELFLNDAPLGAWTGDLEDRLGHATSPRLDGHSATRIYFRAVDLVPGDVLRIVGHPDGIETAAVDYISVLPPGVVD